MEGINQIREIERKYKPHQVLEEYLKIRTGLLKDPLLKALFESKAFKNLANKTQVTQEFITLMGVSTRLTHTLEVTAIAEHIASKFKVDVTNVRRIALFHDVGHLPFGHVGERTIKDIIKAINNTSFIFDEKIPEEQKHIFKKYGNFLHENMDYDVFEDFLQQNKNITTEECEILARSLGLDPDKARGHHDFTNVDKLNFEHPDEKVIQYIRSNLMHRNFIYKDLIPEEERLKLKKYDDFSHAQMSCEIFERILKENNIKLSEADHKLIANGILKHDNGIFNANSVEGKIVGISDKIAYLTRDIEDAIKLGFELDFPKELGNTPEEIRNRIIADLLENSTSEHVALSDEVSKHVKNLKDYMYENFYSSEDLEKIDKKLASHLEECFLAWHMEADDLRDETGYITDIDDSLVEFVSQSDEDVLEYVNMNGEMIKDWVHWNIKLNMMKNMKLGVENVVGDTLIGDGLTDELDIIEFDD
ncbi:MAG: hypothetical protein A2Y18_07950 [Clostridiales bacterium GWD2_32_19]|nr:MAG: hypothetical protein A2Y18_07950 [Clostridiales bacterium GWD2_32_19]